ncbi:MAG: class II glutamine amidotransferase [Myxococcota bacterium]|nr:class II glutamine amidotransferase [Myxococcota bacterium]
MCRLFGFRSALPSTTHRSLVQADNALVEQARAHPHGWGVGYYVGQDAYVLKSGDAAHTSDRFRLASSRLRSQTFVVHVRQATVGGTDYLNAHPFRHGRWIFAHNGSLWGFEELAPELARWIPAQRRALILGQTDSEMLFHYLLSALEAAGFDATGHAGECDAKGAGQVLSGAVDRLYQLAAHKGLEPPIVNFILTDGELMFGLRAGKALFMSTQKHHCPDAETCPEPNKFCLLAAAPVGEPVNHLLLSSEPIGQDDRWESLEQGEMIVLERDFRVHRLPPIPNWAPCSRVE